MVTSLNFLLWMVDGCLSRVVTTSYSFCPAITKDGWMPTLLQDHRYGFPSHSYIGVQNIGRKIFSNAITKEGWMDASFLV